MNRTVLYQEPHPERARTFRSTAEAFRGLEYACAVTHAPRPPVISRKGWIALAVIYTATLVALCWWPR